jgi:tight adherence protein C
VSALAILAAASVLLGLAAAHEMLAGGAPRRSLSDLFPGLRTRSLAAALRLGVPERIARAGLLDRLPAAAVLIAKPAAAAVGAIAGMAAAPAAPGRLSIAVAVAMPAAGFVLPDALLERAARRRQGRLLRALPDALDLLAVNATSGRSPAAGFAELAKGGEGPLAEEFGIVVAETSCGVKGDEALRRLRARSPGGGLAMLCASIERSRRYGSPLAEQLQRQAGSLRRDQRRATEEHAARAAPKIQLVVALVLVPSVLLMIVAGLVANADRLLAGF